jgi:serine beta-lactamase-like protein LACTB, mitochondrial
MADTPDRVNRALLAMHTQQRNVGLSAAVLREGRLVLSECLGFADLEHRVPVKRHTRFMIASINKAFTGAALIKLVEAKGIDLDLPIQRYVPTFPEKGGTPITARLLAAHLGGIRHYSTGEKSPRFFLNHYDDAVAAIELFQADQLIAPPGVEYSYSSYGYNLLAAAIQSASGRSFPTYVHEAIVEPLGLGNILFDDVRRVVRDRARPYSYYDPVTYQEGSELWRVPDWDYSYNMGGGNMLSTAEDLVTFGGAFMEPGFFTQNSLELLHNAQHTAATKSPWSYGWFVKRDAAGWRYLSITGAVPGVQAALIIYPEQKLATAVISNTWGIGADSGEMVSDLPLGISRFYLEE